MLIPVATYTVVVGDPVQASALSDTPLVLSGIRATKCQWAGTATVWPQLLLVMAIICSDCFVQAVGVLQLILQQLLTDMRYVRVGDRQLARRY